MGIMELAVGGLLLSAVSTVSSIASANSAARGQARAAQETARLQVEEYRRQQSEVNRTSSEQKSDVIRQANRELGALRVTAASAGASGGSFLNLVSEIGAIEGTNLSRLEANRKGQVGALEAAKSAAVSGASQAAALARNQARVSNIGSLLSFAGSGLQIGADYNFRQTQLDLAQNPRTT